MSTTNTLPHEPEIPTPEANQDEPNPSEKKQKKESKGGRGRPLKYKKFLDALDDEALYTPSLVVANGEEKGLLDDTEPDDLQHLKLKIRHTLARFSANHQFPKEGDGMVQIPKQATTVGWTGKRWKGAMMN